MSDLEASYKEKDAIITTTEDAIISTKEDAIISKEDTIISNEEKENAVLDLAIEYALHRRYPPGLSKDRKGSVRKKALTITVIQGERFSEEKGSPSKGCHGRCRPAPDSPIMPLRSYLRALRQDKNMEESCRAILLERDVEGSEAVGKFHINFMQR